MKKITLDIGNNGNERINIDSLIEGENNAVQLECYFPDYLLNKYASVEFLLSNGDYFKTPLLLLGSNVYNYELEQNICTGIVYFQVCFTYPNFIQKTKKYKIEFSESINVTQIISNTDIITDFEIRVSTMEGVVEQFVSANETSIEIDSVRTGFPSSISNRGTAKAQRWEVILEKGDKGDKGDTGSLIQIANILLLAENFTLVSGLYEISYANANITANSVVDLVIDKISISIAQAADILYYTESNTGTVKLFSKYLPTANITVIMNIYTKS